MTASTGPQVRCPVCGEIRSRAVMVPAAAVRPAVRDLVRRDHPEWTDDDLLCLSDLHRYRLAQLQSLLVAQRGELTSLDREVVESIRKNELIAENVSVTTEERMTLGSRVADRVAAFGGSWTFLGLFAGTILGWIAINTHLLLTRPFDPYPYILLNLLLSCLAAVQAPVIMMSQNRQEAKDRIRAEHDYQVNLKAELEIRLLHEKMDHLLLHSWQQLMDVQAIQADLLDELSTRLDGLDRT